MEGEKAKSERAVMLEVKAEGLHYRRILLIYQGE